MAPREQKTAKPVELESPYRAPQVEITLTSIKSVEMKGAGPGEISGSALHITVEVSNRTNAAIRLDSAVVNLTDSKGRVGTPYAGDPANPLAGSVRAGGRAVGSYVFKVEKGARSPIRVFVTYEPGVETAVFVGKAS